VGEIAIPVGSAEVTTEFLVQEQRKLKKSIGRLDILFFLLCTIVGFDTVGATAAAGAQAFTWLIFLGIFFFLPYGLLTSELGSTFPEEGGAYEWVKLAFGRPAAAINTTFYWFSNPIWVGGSLAFIALAAFGVFFTPLTGIWKYLFQLAFIWICVLAATVAVRAGKWLQTIGALVRIFVLGFFTLSVVGFRNGVGGVSTGDTHVGFIASCRSVPLRDSDPSNASRDDERGDVPAATLRAFLLAVLLWGTMSRSCSCRSSR
jgi:amino acid transporter